MFHDYKRDFINILNLWLNKSPFFITVIIFSIKESLNDIRMELYTKVARYNRTICDLIPYAQIYGFDLCEYNSVNDINLIAPNTNKVVRKIKSLSLEKTNPDVRNIEIFLKDLTNTSEEVEGDTFISKGCVSILKKLCTQHQINDEKLTREFNDNRIQSTISKSLILIEALTKPKEELNYEQIQQNLKYFPKICGFMSRKWFDQQFMEKSEHPLLTWLSKFNISLLNANEQYIKEMDKGKKTEIANRIRMPMANQIYANHLEKCLGLFDDSKSYRVARIRHGLQKEEDFYQTLSHLELANALKENDYDVEIENNSLGRPLDISATRNGNDIILEVTSIDMIVGLKFGGFQSNVPNKVKSTVLKKLEYQIKHYADKTNDPIIIVIDKSRAHDIDFEDVIFALYGSPAVSIVTDKEAGKIVETFSTLSENGLTLTNEVAKNLSAVILYYSDISWNNLTIELCGQVVINKYSSRKLDFDKAQELSYSLFGHRRLQPSP